MYDSEDCVYKFIANDHVNPYDEELVHDEERIRQRGGLTDLMGQSGKAVLK